MKLPAHHALAEVAIAPGDDPHACGRRAAMRAIHALTGSSEGIAIAYDGTRPYVRGADLAISITHGRTRALAVAAYAERVGIDLVDDDQQQRIATIAPRFLAGDGDPAARFAATEAGLKALGLGLLDGGLFDGTAGDDCAVRVVSLDPPRLEPASLALVLGRVADGTVAIVSR